MIETTERPVLLRVPEVARLLGVSKAHVYRQLSAGLIPAVRIGRSTRVPRAALEELVAGWVAAGSGHGDRR